MIPSTGQKFVLREQAFERRVETFPVSMFLLSRKESFFARSEIPQGKVLERVEVMKEVLDSPVLINIPVAKSHSATGVGVWASRASWVSSGIGKYSHSQV